jgi:hypothetical protein
MRLLNAALKPSVSIQIKMFKEMDIIANQVQYKYYSNWHVTD